MWCPTIKVLVLHDELNYKMQELLEESPDETDAALQEHLIPLQEGYEQDFVRGVRKEDEQKAIPM